MKRKVAAEEARAGVATVKRKGANAAEVRAGAAKVAAATVKRKAANAGANGKEVAKKKKKKAGKVKKWFSPRMATTMSKGLSKVTSQTTSRANSPKKCELFKNKF